MLMLDQIREEFAKHLSDDPTGRWRMDQGLQRMAAIILR